MAGESDLTLEVVETSDDINQAEWNTVVTQSPHGSVFHTYEWLDAIESGLGYAPKHLTIRKSGTLVAVYPNFEIEYERAPVTRVTSLYPGFGGPVANTAESECISLFSEEIPNVGSSQAIVHRIRAREPAYVGFNNLLKAHGYRPTRDGCRFELDLTDGYESVIDGMRRDRRRGIEDGKQQDYEIVAEELTRSNIRRFHETYVDVMDRMDGTTFPLSFLTQLRHMESDVLLLTLRLSGEYVGGMVKLLEEDSSYIHGWLHAVPEEYYDRNASELLYNGVIRWGIENGYEAYDMGYTSSDATNGLFSYKKSYGGDVVPNLSWERGISPVWPLVRTGRNLYWSQVKSPPA
jgi:hypothetical protein